MKTRIILFIVSLLIIFQMAGVAYYMVKVEPTINPVLGQGDPSKIYGMYVNGDPDLKGREYIGDDSAYVTVVAYLEPNSVLSKRFYDETFVYLNNTYIDDGRVRLYIKPLVDLEAYQDNSDSFQLAKTIDCLSGPIDIKFYDLVHNSKPLKGKGLISDECIKGQVSDNLIEDIAEVRAFGIASNPTIYVGLLGNDNQIFEGIPTQDWLDNAIRDNEIQLGD